MGPRLMKPLPWEFRFDQGVETPFLPVELLRKRDLKESRGVDCRTARKRHAPSGCTPHGAPPGPHRMVSTGASGIRGGRIGPTRCAIRPGLVSRHTPPALGTGCNCWGAFIIENQEIIEATIFHTPNGLKIKKLPGEEDRSDNSMRLWSTLKKPLTLATKLARNTPVYCQVKSHQASTFEAVEFVCVRDGENHPGPG